jgi:hypothetical protein
LERDGSATRDAFRRADPVHHEDVNRVFTLHDDPEPVSEGLMQGESECGAIPGEVDGTARVPDRHRVIPGDGLPRAICLSPAS